MGVLMNQLKARMRIAAQDDEGWGFDLLEPEMLRFGEGKDAQFETALKEQVDATEYVDGADMHTVDVSGRVNDGAMRLSRAALSDVCQICNVPVAFLKRVSKFDHDLTSDILESCLRAYWRKAPRKLVVDRRTNRIDGIVGEESYGKYDNVRAYKDARTAIPGVDLTNGWVSGTQMRAAFVRGDKPVEPEKGDIVRIGINIENSMSGECSLLVCDYSEVLKCTNGMTARDADHSVRLIHRGDIEGDVTKALVQIAHHMDDIVPLMMEAATRHLKPIQVGEIASWLGSKENGGNATLKESVIIKANMLARDADRAGDVTLWDVTNAVTFQAHQTQSLKRKGELENLGYRTLLRYGVAAN